MADTIAQTVGRVQRLLHSNTRTELDVLAAAITDTTTPTIAVTYVADGIRNGSYISVDYETMYIHSTNDSNLTVQRGVQGSTAATHLINAQVDVEPRFSNFQIFEAVKDTIRSLPENLFGVSTQSVSYAGTAGDRAVSATLSNGFTRILKAVRTPRDARDRWTKVNVRVQEYDGDYEVILQDPPEKAIDVRITYGHPFVTSSLLTTTNLVSDIKMSESMQDIPALGAAAALVLAEESLRLDSHGAGDLRSEQSIDVGARARYSLMLQAQYERRVSQEARRLMAQYGVRDQAATSALFPTTV